MTVFEENTFFRDSLLYKDNRLLRKLRWALLISLIACMVLLSSCSSVQTTSSDFTMDGAALIKYNGKDTVIDIPENVCEIRENAFNQSSNAAQITSIHLGGNVKAIDFAAFCGLPSLSAVSVSAENPNYLSFNSFLLAVDGSAIFSFGALKLDIYSLINEADDVIKEIPFYEGGYHVVFDDTVLSFSENGALDSAFPVIEDGLLTKINSKGNTVTFAAPISQYGDHAWSLFKAEDAVVFSDLVSYAIGDTYVFTDDGIYEQHNSGYDVNSDYNVPIVVFRLGEDEKLSYTCRPIKFINLGDHGSELVYCVSMDEIYRESGTVIFENSKPKYTAESETTFAQQFDENQIQEMYNFVRDNFSMFVGSDFDSRLDTPEKFLASNAKKYTAFNPSTIHS